MDNFVLVKYKTTVENKGQKIYSTLDFDAKAGEYVYLQGTPSFCNKHFHCLTGFSGIKDGIVQINDQNLCLLSLDEIVGLHKAVIGAVPLSGGLIPGIPIIEQIILPLLLSGEKRRSIIQEIEEKLLKDIPVQALYVSPERCSTKVYGIAALLRAITKKPGVIVMNSFLDDFGPLKNDLWQYFLSIQPKESILVYLSPLPPTDQIIWTQWIKL